jgi:prepilin-type N-terminal cleavage/methylation domain-containing protein
MIEMNNRRAFTLIEMLVVIAIIGIIAALVVGMNNAAQTKKRLSQVQSDLHKIRFMIDNYQAKLNFYPPDNTNIDGFAATDTNYDLYASINPLLYELTGAVLNYQNNPSQMLMFDSNVVLTSTYYNAYGRTAVMNANPDEPRNFFRPGPKATETNFYTAPYPTNLAGLVVPVPNGGPNNTALATNFWRYDCSSTNRHNAGSYDLWAEFIIGSKNGQNVVVTNGNW